MACHPHEAHHVKKGEYMMLKDCPCKIIQVKTAKTGKHGHAKCNITGKDVRDGKKKHELQPGHIVMRQFDYKRVDIEVTNVNKDEGTITFLNEKYEEEMVDVDFPEDRKHILNEFLKAYKENESSGGDKIYQVTVISVPVGKPGVEELDTKVVGWKELKDTDND